MKYKDTLVAGGLGFVAVEVAAFIYSLFLPATSFLPVRANPILLSHILFYDLHNPAASLGIVGSNLFTLVPVTSLLFVVPVLTPPLVLVFQARDLVGDGETVLGPRRSAVRGASVSLGYVPPALVTLPPAFGYVTPSDVLFTAVYPVIFGAVGGYTATR